MATENGWLEVDRTVESFTEAVDHVRVIIILQDGLESVETIKDVIKDSAEMILKNARIIRMNPERTRLYISS